MLKEKGKNKHTHTLEWNNFLKCIISVQLELCTRPDFLDIHTEEEEHASITAM